MLIVQSARRQLCGRLPSAIHGPYGGVLNQGLVGRRQVCNRTSPLIGVIPPPVAHRSSTASVDVHHLAWILRVLHGRATALDRQLLQEVSKPRKVPRTAASDASSLQTVSHVDIAAECLNQLRAVKASQGSKENHDFPYFFCMSLAEQLRLLSPHQRVDAVTALQQVMLEKINEARLQRELGN